LAQWRQRQTEKQPLDHWRYRVDWVPVPERPARLSGTWLILAPTDAVPMDCLEALTMAGAQPIVITGATYQETLTKTTDVTGVLSLLTLEPVTFAATVQTLSAAGIRAPLWVTT